MKKLNSKKQLLYIGLGLLCNICVLSAQSVDYDTDDNGLIEVSNLDQLNAIRWDLDGDGAVSDANGQTMYGEAFPITSSSSAYGSIRCGDGITITQCSGYELMMNLDFANSNWADGASGNDAVAGGWEPIGNNSSLFNTMFEGNGYTISNLYINRANTNFVGLFGSLSKDAKLRNLGIESGNVTGKSSVGSLAGSNEGGYIISCYAMSTPSGASEVTGMGSGAVGGIVGLNRGMIRGNYATWNVNAAGDAGGIVGINHGVLLECYATGTVNIATTKNHRNAGGLVGWNTGDPSVYISPYIAVHLNKIKGGTIFGCYATGDVRTNGASGDAGGLVGRNAIGSIRACYATGNAAAEGLNGNAGGLVGLNTATVRTSYATGNAETEGENGDVGGLIGENAGSVSTCYATGNSDAIDATSSGRGHAGGLIGWNDSGFVINCYARGDVSTRNGFYSSTIGKNDAFSIDGISPTQKIYSEASDLQGPIAYTAIFSTWNIDVDNNLGIGSDNAKEAGDASSDDPWDFGTATDYPALKVDFDVDGTPSAYEFGMQGRAAPSLAISSIEPAEGVVGSTVVIVGTGFSSKPSENTVTFAGVEARVVNAGTTELVVIVPGGAATGNIEVEVSSTTQESGTFTVVPFTDRDSDANGLIDVTTLEQLDAIRYDLNGNGIIDASVGAAGARAYESAFSLSQGGAISCTGNCAGYELMDNLDFANSNWAEGASGNNAVSGGWMPIGDNSRTDASDNKSPRRRYMAIFDGNSNMISNLYIDRSNVDLVGLFGIVDTGAEIRRLGIVDGKVKGRTSVGCLVGENGGRIRACYATGSVNAVGTGSSAASAGGLIGINVGMISECYTMTDVEVAGDAGVAGGLIGLNAKTTIRVCYATGNVTGANRVGSLVGWNYQGWILASYATGNAVATQDDGSAGGLVGSNDGGGYITDLCQNLQDCEPTTIDPNTIVGGVIRACYATGDATQRRTAIAGGLTGKRIRGGTSIDSYFDDSSPATQAAGNDASVSGLDKAASELQTPIDYTGIYADWNIDKDGATGLGDFWNFGTTSQYPALRADMNGDFLATAYEFGVQGRAAPPMINTINPEFGPIGETVTITGTGFSTTNTDNNVTFRGNAADDTDDKMATISGTSTATQLEVTVPADARTGNIIVRVMNGAPGISMVEFEVVPEIDIDDIDPGSGAVGDPIEIIGTGFSVTAAENEVSFDGGTNYVMATSIKAEVSADADTLTVNVPSDAVTGTIWVKVNNGTPVMSTQTFTVTGGTDPPSLAITSISPTSGPVGEEVTIEGQNFGATAADNMVTFLGDESDEGDNQVATISEASTTRLVVNVPDGAVSGPIEVEVDSETTTSDPFTVLAADVLAITSISPTSGPVGEEVTIEGQNFGATAADNMVTFLGDESDEGDNQVATISEASTTRLVVNVPDGAVSGPIEVEVDSETTTSDPFTVLAADVLAITSISPTEGAVGEEVTITGQNFGATAADNMVTFLGTNDDGSDDRVATISDASTTRLVVNVPDGAVSGPIEVEVNGVPVTSTDIFTVTDGIEPPTPPSLAITSFSPGSGAVGDPIKIAGTGFSSTTADNELSFDGGATYVVANDFIADTRTGVDPTIDTVVVNVPAGAVSGPIEVEVNGETATSTETFTVLAADELAITSISPTRGAVGEEVTITGQNFGDMIADNTVTFLGDESDEGDNQVATISEASTTRLVVNVPDDVVSGPIEVEVNGVPATSETFTVTTETPFSVSKSSDVIRVYPNPTSAELSFRSLSSTGTYVCKVYSLLGEEMLSGVVRSSTTIDMSYLSEGQYILVLSSEEDSEVLRTRLLIVR